MKLLRMALALPTGRRSRARLRAAVVAVAAVAGVVLPALSAQEAGKSFLWKVTGRTTSIYLAGSVHVLSKEYYPLSAALETAFKDTDLLVEEVDLAAIDPDAQSRLISKSMLPNGETLEKLLSPATLALVRRTGADLGVPVDALMRLKPWAVSLMLTDLTVNKAGFDGSLGLDKHFEERARAEGRLVQGLETAEFQISLFDEMALGDQDRLLVQTIKDLETATGHLKEIANAWRTGNVAIIEKYALDELRKEPVLQRKLLTDRNRNWLPKIEALFNRRGRAFVVVGAAHLVGPDGLLEMLEEKGYRIEQM